MPMRQAQPFLPGFARADDEATLALRLQLGASARLADRGARTPLRLAQSRGFTAMTVALQAAGAR